MQRIATVDGQGTGRVSPNSDFIEVESDNANKIITLPTPRIGRVFALRNGGTGYELRSSDPEDVSINGGSGVNAESAIAASMLVTCLCDTDTSYLCVQVATDGTSSAVEAAAP